MFAPHPPAASPPDSSDSSRRHATELARQVEQPRDALQRAATGGSILPALDGLARHVSQRQSPSRASPIHPRDVPAVALPNPCRTWTRQRSRAVFAFDVTQVRRVRLHPCRPIELFRPTLQQRPVFAELIGHGYQRPFRPEFEIRFESSKGFALGLPALLLKIEPRWPSARTVVQRVGA